MKKKNNGLEIQEMKNTIDITKEMNKEKASFSLEKKRNPNYSSKKNRLAKLNEKSLFSPILYIILISCK